MYFVLYLVLNELSAYSVQLYHLSMYYCFQNVMQLTPVTEHLLGTIYPFFL